MANTNNQAVNAAILDLLENGQETEIDTGSSRVKNRRMRAQDIIMLNEYERAIALQARRGRTSHFNLRFASR